MIDPVVILELQQCNVKNAVLHDLKLMCQMSIGDSIETQIRIAEYSTMLF